MDDVMNFEDLARAEVSMPDGYTPMLRLAALLAVSPGEWDLSSRETHELLYDLWAAQSKRRPWLDGYATCDITLSGGPAGEFDDTRIVPVVVFDKPYMHVSINNVARIPLAPATAEERR